MRAIPPELTHGPFSRRHALDLGLSERVLQGPRFRRLHQAVYVHRDHVMTWADHVEAARLALPATARSTGATRLRQLGLEVGAPFPLRFVVQGDLHLVLDGVFLHRTVMMPPHDHVGVALEAAYVAFCAEARMIDAIGAGSLLLHQGLLDGDLLDHLLAEQTWRRGIPETRRVLPFLDGRCRSIPEAELLAYVGFAGLPRPEVNEAVVLRDGTRLTPDQWYPQHGLAVEYEGSQHQEDRAQYTADIDRYAAYRRNAVPYEQVTKELMRSPRATVRRVHAALVARGYSGPEPDFGDAWPLLFTPLAELVCQRRAG